MPTFYCTAEVVVELEFSVEAETEEEAREAADYIQLTERGGRGEDGSLTVESNNHNLRVDSLCWGQYDVYGNDLSIEEC